MTEQADQLRQRLADAGLLSPVTPLETEAPDPAAVAAARARAGQGRSLAEYVTADW